jgi:nucleotide-binding universal stress UspA family protein
VPIDFSPESFAAAAFAGALAEQTGARIRFVTVLDVGDLRAALKAQLHGFTTEAEVHEALTGWIREQYARFAEEEIIAAIEKYRPQLVVMGSRGLSRRVSVGSKTAAVLRRSDVPVLVVRK